MHQYGRGNRPLGRNAQRMRAEPPSDEEKQGGLTSAGQPKLNPTPPAGAAAAPSPQVMNAYSNNTLLVGAAVALVGALYFMRQ